MEEDSLLVKRVLNGDLEAYDHLVRKYMNRIYFLLYRMMGRTEDAKDLTQECFLRAYQHLASFQPDRRFSSWLYQIAIHLCYNESRKQKRKEVSLEAEPFVDRETPETVFIRKEDYLLYRKELDRLPENYRAVLLLRYHEGLSYQEISDVLEITVKVVRNYLYRAKKKLKKQFSTRAKEGKPDEMLV
ncbi:RNA polymerase sigma factor [Lihuaxuella thermophila]|uniref:RNA polymerase sigma-70 factor, ECF subfamily n=1 Tax=Lihuaxuella thermophila TaxID=1173111 RepID=A0A1H8AIT1_9BACL|nr:RNA polymerase sigma factor [Lihuaxuella thermophila]SEM70531.1 RNA polymerase sigma-70 factor, ECF subfamily [Lihuaxuella thermophila]